MKVDWEQLPLFVMSCILKFAPKLLEGHVVQNNIVYQVPGKLHIVTTWCQKKKNLKKRMASNSCSGGDV